MASGTAWQLDKSSWPSQILIVCRLGKGLTTPETQTTHQCSSKPYRANFFFGRGFNLEIFAGLIFFWTRFQLRNFSEPAGVRVHPNFVVHLQSSSEVVYKSWTRSALLKGTSKCFLVSSITCRSKEAIEWVWFKYKLSFVVKLSTKPHPQTGSLH